MIISSIMNKTLIVLLLFLLSFPAYAVVDSDEICFYHTTRAEKQHKIKKNILSTITLVETGRSGKNDSVGYPWPWTIAYKDKGLYFKTKEEAVAKVKELQKQGIRSIDVGCMQINLYYHGEHFSSVEQALDPVHNVRYAATFLKRLYKKHGTWGGAATAYHSHEPTKAHRYETKLIKVWSKLKKHLASGGKLYNEPVTTNIVHALETPPTLPPIVLKEPTTNIVSPPVRPDNSTDYAKQWRAKKMTEYRLKKTNSIQIYKENVIR